MDFKLPRYTSQPPSPAQTRPASVKAPPTHADRAQEARSVKASRDVFVRNDTVSISPAATAAMQYELSGDKGYRESYTIKDAAVSLWQQRQGNSKPQSLETLLQSEGFKAAPSDTELTQFVSELRAKGIDKAVNWQSLSKEFTAFRSISYEELSAGLEYLTSRYVSVSDKLARSGAGNETEALRSLYSAGIGSIVTGYTDALQERLGLSGETVSRIKDSFSAILEHMTGAYQKGLSSVRQQIAAKHPSDRWLLDHDPYIAAKLRESCTAPGDAAAPDARYTLQDMEVMGWVGRLYYLEAEGARSGSRSEGSLAINTAMLDMKAEYVIRSGGVSGEMAALLRDTRAGSHDQLLNIADSRTEAKRPIDRTAFGGIYGAMLGAFQQSGDAEQAIRAGALCGQALTAHASEDGTDDFWTNFYVTPTPERTDPNEEQLQRLFARVGQSRHRNSTFQNYVNDWTRFTVAMGVRGL